MPQSPPDNKQNPPRPWRLTAILLAIVLIAVAVWYILRPEGLLQQVTEERVQEALVANGIPMPMAGCMAPRLSDRLTIDQLRNLEKIAPEPGETRFPKSTGEALVRLRRVDDREAVETLVTVAGGCGFDLLLKRN